MDLINDNIRAEQIGNLDLSQSRRGTVVTCETDFSGMQIDVGDIVDLTNTDFGFGQKDFRVLRHQEKVSEGGMINCALTLLEYSDNVYVQPNVTESNVVGNIEIPPITPPIILPPIVYKNIIGNVTDFTTSGSGTNAVFTVFTDSATGTYSAAIATTGGSGFAVTDTIEISGVNLQGTDPDNNLTMTVDAVTGGAIDVVGLGNVSGDAVVYDQGTFGGILTREAMGDIAVGGQIEDKPADKTDLSDANTLADLITTRELDFTEGNGLEPGDYSFMSAGAPIAALGGNTTTANFSFVSNVNIEYANGTVQNENFGAVSTNNDDIPTIMEANKKITVGPNPVSGNVTLQGLNTALQNGGSRGFFAMRYDMLRITKGDVF